MKKSLSVVLAFALLLGCAPLQAFAAEEETDIPDFQGLDDPALLQYVEDDLYATLEDEFASDDYIIEDITAVYKSKEYIEEVAYNSQENIFFGHTLTELEEQFEGQRFVFTMGEDGSTDVQMFEEYDDTFDRAIKNVAVGSGVILICVTVSVVSGGVGATPVCAIFAASAKTGTVMALSSGALGSISAGLISGLETGDMDEAVKAAALAGSEGFKWGAIGGAITGGLSEAIALKNPVVPGDKSEVMFNGIPSAKESETYAQELYPGRGQISYFHGEEVVSTTRNATRPDIVRDLGDHLEAIEVKNYNLDSPHGVSSLCNTLKRQIGDRVTNMPAGTSQRVVLDTRGRNTSAETIEKVILKIKEACNSVYMDLPVDVIAA